ncbi:MAG: hypothetical protein VCF25_03310 [Candidatus Poribacteria bacterium]
MTAVAITLGIAGRIINMKLIGQVLKIMKRHLYPIRLPRWSSRLSMVASAALALCAPSLNAQGETTRMAKKALGLNKITAFYGAYPELKSQTFARGSDWKYWNKRGGIVSRGVVHQAFLSQNVAEASDYLAKLDFGDNPTPVIDIDELGWDFDEGIDRHSMEILKATHNKRSDLKIAIWQMRESRHTEVGGSISRYR